MTARPDDIPTVTGQVVAVQIMVVCECGEHFCHEIECEEDDFGGWSAAMEERFILCDTCDRLIDAGLRLTVMEPS